MKIGVDAKPLSIEFGMLKVIYESPLCHRKTSPNDGPRCAFAFFSSMDCKRSIHPSFEPNCGLTCNRDAKLGKPGEDFVGPSKEGCN